VDEHNNQEPVRTKSVCIATLICMLERRPNNSEAGTLLALLARADEAVPSRGRSWTMWSSSGVATVILAGEFDRVDCDSFGHLMVGVLAERPIEVVLDLRRVTFVDLGFVEAMLEAVDAGRAQAAGCRILHPPRSFSLIVSVLRPDGDIGMTDEDGAVFSFAIESAG
jgi:hypothetical protein